MNIEKIAQSIHSSYQLQHPEKLESLEKGTETVGAVAFDNNKKKRNDQNLRDEVEKEPLPNEEELTQPENAADTSTEKKSHINLVA